MKVHSTRLTSSTQAQHVVKVFEEMPDKRWNELCSYLADRKAAEVKNQWKRQVRVDILRMYGLEPPSTGSSSPSKRRR